MRIQLVIGCLALGLGLGAACGKKKTTDPETGSNLLGGIGAEGGGGDDEFGDGDSLDEFGEGEDGEDAGDEAGELADAGDAKKGKTAKLPKRGKPVKKCRGKGKKRKCKMVDPKPKVSASHGVVTLMGDFRWGMSPAQVVKVLSASVEAEYGKRMKKATDPMRQDRTRKWRSEQITAIKANRVKFRKSARHRWRVSLVRYEFEDDNGEEMVWIKTTPTLRKFYFFKDGELWKIFYAYSTDTWPGKTYAQVVEEKFKKWFGYSPAEKDKKDPKTQASVLKYNEWTAMKGEKIRSFDMTAVGGVIALAVVDGNAEKSLGERLPNVEKDEGFSDVVNDVLGGKDVCYNNDGDIVECGSEGAKDQL